MRILYNSTVTLQFVICWLSESYVPPPGDAHDQHICHLPKSLPGNWTQEPGVQSWSFNHWATKTWDVKYDACVYYFGCYVHSKIHYINHYYLLSNWMQYIIILENGKVKFQGSYEDITDEIPNVTSTSKRYIIMDSQNLYFIKVF